MKHKRVSPNKKLGGISLKRLQVLQLCYNLTTSSFLSLPGNFTGARLSPHEPYTLSPASRYDSQWSASFSRSSSQLYFCILQCKWMFLLSKSFWLLFMQEWTWPFNHRGLRKTWFRWTGLMRVRYSVQGKRPLKNWLITSPAALTTTDKCRQLPQAT